MVWCLLNSWRKVATRHVYLVIISLYSPGINRHAPARHGEAGPGHVHRLAGHGHQGGARLRDVARVADRDLGPEPRVPDLRVKNIHIFFFKRQERVCSPGAALPC